MKNAQPTSSASVRPFNPWRCPVPKPHADARILIPKFETYDRAIAEANLRVAQLRETNDHEYQVLADTIAACASFRQRCLLSACPICLGRLRLWFFEQQIEFWSGYDDLSFWTFIPAEMAVATEQLHRISPQHLGDALRQQLSRADITGPIIGGWDGNYDPAYGIWQPHCHFIAPASLNRQLWALGARYYPKGPGVYRPVLCQKVADRAQQFSYCLKTYWWEIPRYWVGTSQRRASPRRLAKGRHIQWLLWRAKYPVAAFIFLAGVRRRGCKLVELGHSATRHDADDVTT